MGRTIVFDTHTYVKKLRSVGFTEEQAEALAKLVDERLTTKQDLRELELRLTIRLGTIVATGIAIVATLVKLL
jgi:hypothetical protein